MSMPGFTAEALLPTRPQSYRVVGSLHSPAKGPEVVPQFCYTNPAGVTTCCFCYRGWCWCRRIPRVLQV